jgi:hypothetical protein
MKQKTGIENILFMWAVACRKKAAADGEYRTSFVHLLPSFNGSCKAGRCSPEA